MEIKIDIDSNDAMLIQKISMYVGIPVETLVKYWVRRELATHMVR